MNVCTRDILTSDFREAQARIQASLAHAIRINQDPGALTSSLHV
jgi:hypothetical protein